MENLELCALWGYGENVNGKPIRCSNALEGHHILNKSKYTKNKKIKAYVKKHQEMFIIDVCNVHNGETKLADTPAARRILLEAKVDLLTEEYVQPIWDGQPWKVVPHELTYDAIMACPLP